MSKILQKKLMRVLCGWGLLLSGATHATLVLPKTRAQLVAETSVVVWGEVVQIDVAPTYGYRSAVLEAREIVRAPESFKSLRDFSVVLENRYLEKNDLIEQVAAAPELRVGEQVLLFLEPYDLAKHPMRAEYARGPLFSLRGFYQGIYRVFDDSAGVKRVVAWNEMDTQPLSAQELKAQKKSARAKLSLKTPALPADAKTKILGTLNALVDEVRASAGPVR